MAPGHPPHALQNPNGDTRPHETHANEVPAWAVALEIPATAAMGSETDDETVTNDSMTSSFCEEYLRDNSSDEPENPSSGNEGTVPGDTDADASENENEDLYADSDSLRTVRGCSPPPNAGEGSEEHSPSPQAEHPGESEQDTTYWCTRLLHLLQASAVIHDDSTLREQIIDIVPRSKEADAHAHNAEERTRAEMRGFHQPTQAWLSKNRGKVELEILGGLERKVSITLKADRGARDPYRYKRRGRPTEGSEEASTARPQLGNRSRMGSFDGRPGSPGAQDSHSTLPPASRRERNMRGRGMTRSISTTIRAHQDPLAAVASSSVLQETEKKVKDLEADLEAERREKGELKKGFESQKALLEQHIADHKTRNEGLTGDVEELRLELEIEKDEKSIAEDEFENLKSLTAASANANANETDSLKAKIRAMERREKGLELEVGIEREGREIAEGEKEIAEAEKKAVEEEKKIAEVEKMIAEEEKKTAEEGKKKAEQDLEKLKQEIASTSAPEVTSLKAQTEAQKKKLDSQARHITSLEKDLTKANETQTTLRTYLQETKTERNVERQVLEPQLLLTKSQAPLPIYKSEGEWAKLYEAETKRYKKLKPAYEKVKIEALKLYDEIHPLRQSTTALTQRLERTQDHIVHLQAQLSKHKALAAHWESEYRSRVSMNEAQRIGQTTHFDKLRKEMLDVIQVYHERMPDKDPDWWHVEGLRRKVEDLEMRLGAVKREKGVAYDAVSRLEEEVRVVGQESERLRLVGAPVSPPASDAGSADNAVLIWERNRMKARDLPCKWLSWANSLEAKARREKAMEEFRARQEAARNQRDEAAAILEDLRRWRMAGSYPAAKKKWAQEVQRTEWQRWEGDAWWGKVREGFLGKEHVVESLRRGKVWM
ncbi:hypothetical protein K458DRAFT_402158 [Lentithecium fluviatile CBS 122367]|uniref:Uncharacterized protein n=1 Tax=Lentithecium fluviatile CBS 122367 TaxID=1168545 RepID=A0A6G1J8K3_9PLEO|nr:hypothetical protein K458DRAFT_402158 [Lentithecium fluviatile CBS 122367]